MKQSFKSTRKDLIKLVFEQYLKLMLTPWNGLTLSAWDPLGRWRAEYWNAVISSFKIERALIDVNFPALTEARTRG
jgi:hypothetical protein